MILVDSNVFMYAAGADHPNKLPSVRWVERIARLEVNVAVDAEVLQEILHRYRSIRRWAEGMRVYEQVRRLVPAVIPVTAEVLDRARVLLDDHDHLMARDAIHAAVVFEHSLAGICSFDRDFDSIDGFNRIDPTTS